MLSWLDLEFGHFAATKLAPLLPINHNLIGPRAVYPSRSRAFYMDFLRLHVARNSLFQHHFNAYRHGTAGHSSDGPTSGGYRRSTEGACGRTRNGAR